MTEFKISNDLVTEVKNVGLKALLLNDGYIDISVENLETLSTAMGYVAQHKDIKDLVNLYREFVVKDVVDMHKMIQEAEQMDNSIMTNTFVSGGQ